jgi:hypothetical protein
MRFYKGTAAQFDAMRLLVMDALELPSNGTLEPWQVGVTSLALAPHEYQPAHLSALIDDALDMGIEEITAAEYAELQPISPLEL